MHDRRSGLLAPQNNMQATCNVPKNSQQALRKYESAVARQIYAKGAALIAASDQKIENDG